VREPRGYFAPIERFLQHSLITFRAAQEDRDLIESYPRFHEFAYPAHYLNALQRFAGSRKHVECLICGPSLRTMNGKHIVLRQFETGASRSWEWSCIDSDYSSQAAMFMLK
jgi:hypothetical protein